MVGGRCFKEVVDGLQDCVVSCVVPSLLQGIGAGIEDVDQGLTLAAQIAGWGWQLLPHVQVSIVREGVGEGVQGKLEDSLREGHNCGRPQAGALLVLSFNGWFWTTRFMLWERRASVSAASTCFLARVLSCLEEAPGSSFMAWMTSWKGLKVGLCWVASFLVSWLAIALTMGSLEQVYVAALVTCSFW